MLHNKRPVLLFLSFLGLLVAALGMGGSAESTPLQSSTANTMDGASCVTTPVPRVALAGDSWAWYMYDRDDDDLHNHDIIFDKFGQGDKSVIGDGADSLASYNAFPEAERVDKYTVGGTQARHWADLENWPLQTALNKALTLNPTVDIVMFSIGGNDFLEVPARDSDTISDPLQGGWYQYMDLDYGLGFEQSYFDLALTNAMAVITNTRAVHPSTDFLMTSYDYPNFNNEPIVPYCELYSCNKRRELSYKDPLTSLPSPLISDIDINDLLARVEKQRGEMIEAYGNGVFYDNGMGLNHYYYGYDFSPYMHGGNEQADPGTLPYPERTFPYTDGGNPLLPSIRPNFRPFPFPITNTPSDLDPLHLTDHAYQYKITNQVENYFLDKFRGEPTATFFSQGGDNDGWTDGTTFGIESIQIGDAGEGVTVYGIVSFDTSNLPDDVAISAASFYLLRDVGGEGSNPFESGALGSVQVDVANGFFGGSAAVEVGDAGASADASDIACAHGSAREEHFAIRFDVTSDGLTQINRTGTTQFRIAFTLTDAEIDRLLFKDGDSERLPAGTTETTNVVYNLQNHFIDSIVHEGLANVMGTPHPFLDVKYTSATTPTAITLNGGVATVQPFAMILFAVMSLLLLGTLMTWRKRELL